MLKQTSVYAKQRIVPQLSQYMMKTINYEKTDCSVFIYVLCHIDIYQAKLNKQQTGFV